MIKFFAKWAIWAVVGVVVMVMVLNKMDIQTPWQYTVQSTVAPGTQVSFTEPNGETISTPEVTIPTVATKTFDFGTLVLAVPYIAGSVVGYIFRGRKRVKPVLGG